MSVNDLLSYYEQELAFIRELGAEFGKAHPKIAARLRLGEHMVEDPHVGRIMEAFALSNARIRHKLDDDLPEISDALLNILHPHFLAPIPSMSILQMQQNSDELTRGINLLPGVELNTVGRYGPKCIFRTCYPVTLYPIYVETATLQSKPLQAPSIPQLIQCSAVLRISLSCNQSQQYFSSYGINSLRFFINEQPQNAYALYELLFNSTIAIAIANSPTDPNPIILDKSCLRAVGFAEEEGLLPYGKRTFMGYRHLLEFFTLPEKFLFFDLDNLKEKIEQKCHKPEQKLEFYIYLQYSNSPLERSLNASSFALGCTPIVNLYEATGETFRLDQMQSEYRVHADYSRLPTVSEIYSIKSVNAVDIDDTSKSINCQPFYGLKNADEAYYYHSSRKPAWLGTSYQSNSSEVFLSFSDIHLNPLSDNQYEIETSLMCTNANLPRQLPFGGGEPELTFHQCNHAQIKKAECLMPFTSSHRPFLKNGARWKLISHLSLNHLSLTDDEEGVKALKSILKIYDFGLSPVYQNLIEGIIKIESSQTTTRNPDIRRSGNVFWQGTKIKLVVDEHKFTGLGVYLFGSILDRFFGLYSAINSFTELEITTLEREQTYRWKPRAGENQLI